MSCVDRSLNYANTQVCSLCAPFPPSGMASELCKRVAIVVIAPFAYVALAFAKVAQMIWNGVSGLFIYKRSQEHIAIDTVLDAIENDIKNRIPSKFPNHPSSSFIISYEIRETHMRVGQNNPINVKNLTCIDMVKGAFKALFINPSEFKKGVQLEAFILNPINNQSHYCVYTIHFDPKNLNLSEAFSEPVWV